MTIFSGIVSPLKRTYLPGSGPNQPFSPALLKTDTTEALVEAIKISGPYRNTTVAADIVAGEVKYGDEVKPE